MAKGAGYLVYNNIVIYKTLKLRLETKRVKVGEDIEYPDFAFDFAYGGVGAQETDVMYLVPSDKEDIVKAQSSEIAAHLMGRYR